MRDCKGLRRTLCLVCCLSWYFTGTQAAARLDAIEIGTADELQTVQRLFDAAVTLADNIYEETGDLDAHVAQLRAALQLCPACPLTVPGLHLFVVFVLIECSSCADHAWCSCLEFIFDIGGLLQHVTAKRCFSWTVLRIDKSSTGTFCHPSTMAQCPWKSCSLACSHTVCVSSTCLPVTEWL